MHTRTEARVAAVFFELAERGATTLVPAGRRVDPATYTSHARFARERDLLFRRSPVVVAASVDLPAPGATLGVTSGGIALELCRAADGSVGARAAHGPVACAEAHGLVVVRPCGTEPIDTDAFFGALGAEIDCFGPETYHVFSRTESEWQCNWKLLVDTFLESYHVPFLHRASLGDQPGDRMYFEAIGDHLRIPVPGPTLYEQHDRPAAERRVIGHATVQHHLHPNVLFNHVFDYFVLWRFEPLAVDRTRALLTRYWPTPVDDTLRAKLDRRFAWQAKLTLDEDYPASERIHRSLCAGVVPHTLLGRNEGAVIHFHQTIERRLAEESS